MAGYDRNHSAARIDRPFLSHENRKTRAVIEPSDAVLKNAGVFIQRVEVIRALDAGKTAIFAIGLVDHYDCSQHAHRLG